MALAPTDRVRRQVRNGRFHGSQTGPFSRAGGNSLSLRCRSQQFSDKIRLTHRRLRRFAKMNTGRTCKIIKRSKSRCSIGCKTTNIGLRPLRTWKTREMADSLERNSNRLTKYRKASTTSLTLLKLPRTTAIRMSSATTRTIASTRLIRADHTERPQWVGWAVTRVERAGKNVSIGGKLSRTHNQPLLRSAGTGRRTLTQSTPPPKTPVTAVRPASPTRSHKREARSHPTN